MTRTTETLPSDYFEDKYKSDIDPWRFRTSGYEQEKYVATVAALTKPLYDMALEAGCSIGVLSRLLAPRCARLVAIDASATAIAAAKASGPSNVSFEVQRLPEQFPAGRFDLIVLSEILYYFSRSDLMRVAAGCVEAIAPEGEILLCHWLGETDYPLTGHEASDLFAEHVVTKMPVRVIVRNDVYRLERFLAK